MQRLGGTIMSNLCVNTLAMEADVNYFAFLPHHVGMDVVGVIGQIGS